MNIELIVDKLFFFHLIQSAFWFQMFFYVLRGDLKHSGQSSFLRNVLIKLRGKKDKIRKETWF